MPSVKPMTNVAFHAQALKRVRRVLRTKCGLRVHQLEPWHVSDFETADGHMIAVRTAHWAMRKQTVRVHGKTYTYTYKCIQYNCHEHGKRPKHEPDTWILLGEKPSEAWIIPNHAMQGAKTVRIVATKKPHNRWMRFRGAWELLTA